MTSTISVALCTLNGARFIEDQLDTILAQSRLPDEIVAVDDGSSDQTVDILRDYAAASRIDFRVHVNAGRLGVSRNFERAISATRGDLICLADQDDRWQPDKLAAIDRAFALSPNALMVHSNATLADAAGGRLRHTLFEALALSAGERAAYQSGDVFRILLRRNLVTGATAAIRRPLLQLASPFPDVWLHDEWLAIVAAFYGQIVRLDECLVEYRQHAHNQIGIHKRSLLDLAGEISGNRGAHYAKVAHKLRLLREHLHNDTVEFVDLKILSLLDGIEHFALLADLPDNVLHRVAPIYRELSSGRYAQFGNGLRSAVRDAIQPPIAKAQRASFK